MISEALVPPALLVLAAAAGAVVAAAAGAAGAVVGLAGAAAAAMVAVGAATWGAGALHAAHSSRATPTRSVELMRFSMCSINPSCFEAEAHGSPGPACGKRTMYSPGSVRGRRMPPR